MQARPRHRSDEMIDLLTQARFQTSIGALEVLKPSSPDYTQLIKLMNVPNLLVVGDMGSVVSHEMATKLALLDKLLQVAQIKEAGHGIPMISLSVFQRLSKLFYAH